MGEKRVKIRNKIERKTGGGKISENGENDKLKGLSCEIEMVTGTNIIRSI
jgi:hypothetical protein